MSEQRVRTALARNVAHQSKVTRKDFTDRLGLPESATNAEVFAAVDAARTSLTRDPDSTLYDRVMGKLASPAATVTLTDDQLFAKVMGR